MPRHSHSRDRYRGRDSDWEREYAKRRRYDDDHDDDYDDDLEEVEYRPDRRYRRQRSSRPRGESRGYYESRDYYESPGESPHRRRRERERSKAKESPLTSPAKKGDRRRDREGHRRHRSYDQYGSPSREVRDRSERTRDERSRRYRDADTEARRERRRERDREATARKHQSSESTNSASHLLSADALARLGVQHDEEDRAARSRAADEARRERKRRKKRPLLAEDADDSAPLPEEPPRISKGRVASGAYLEEGRSPDMNVRRRGGGGPPFDPRWRKEGWDDSVDGADQRPFWKRKKWWIALAVLIVLLAIIIPVAVVVSKKNNKDDDNSDSSSDSDGDPANSNLNSISRSDIPESAKGTVLDPFSWYDTTDFNVTYTDETVGGLPVMGLNSSWDDSTRANEHVPPLNEPFPYGQRPIRGVNLGGWLSIEPFITPSFFEDWSARDNVVDEWTLTKKLGGTAASTLERHYANFIKEQDFAEIKEAGMDHVRIQYSYWAVKTYDGDPYVPKIAWRYLLRAIEYCRKYGLRVKLDIHGIPGSQNGWNHSGRQGDIRWLVSSDGDLNRKRSLEIHDQLSKFFAQDRYKNILTIYGLVNEPFMLSLPVKDVLDWSVEATKLIQKNGITAFIAIHDGFLNLSKWKKMLQDRPPKMMLDTHQYTTFNIGQIGLNHTAKVNEICTAWYPMLSNINSTSEGWGPTMCGEWSQADTDCAKFLNDVGRGTRWEGTLNPDDNTPHCPTAESGPPCTCEGANADPSTYSDGYKKYLQTYAEAQMSAFETAEGWFYWTWHTESAAQWSYKTAWKNGFMPKKAYAPDFKCGDDIPDFGELPEHY